MLGSPEYSIVAIDESIPEHHDLIHSLRGDLSWKAGCWNSPYREQRAIVTNEIINKIEMNTFFDMMGVLVFAIVFPRQWSLKTGWLGRLPDKTQIISKLLKSINTANVVARQLKSWSQWRAKQTDLELLCSTAVWKSRWVVFTGYRAQLLLAVGFGSLTCCAISYRMNLIRGSVTSRDKHSMCYSGHVFVE